MKQQIQKAFAVLGMWALIVAGAAAALIIELLDLLFRGISHFFQRLTKISENGTIHVTMPPPQPCYG